MPAVISIEQQSGNSYGSVQVGKSEFYFISIDDCLSDYDDYKVQILDSGTNYSYEVWLRFRMDGVAVNNCSNFKLWTTGSLSVGLDITVNINSVTVYSTPTDVESAQGTRGSILNYTSVDKLDISGTLAEIGDKSDFMIFQLEVSDTTEFNILGYEELDIFFQYDET